MNFTIKDGRQKVWQWDQDVVLILEGVADGTEIHLGYSATSVLKKTVENGEIVVPNILLTRNRDIPIFVYDGDNTTDSALLEVVGRPKPPDYVYTDQEKLTWELLSERLDTVNTTLDNQREFIETVGNNSLPFIISVTGKDEVYTANQTYADTMAAFNTGRRIVCELNAKVPVDNGDTYYAEGAQIPLHTVLDDGTLIFQHGTVNPYGMSLEVTFMQDNLIMAICFSGGTGSAGGSGGGSGGQPVAVTTAAKMTDTAVIYVYMGEGETVDGVTYTTGHMYYYSADISTWADSGLYGVGKAGKDGKNGTPGEDGYSPSVSVSETDTGVKITVTDQSGTTEATVENGTATTAQVAAWLDAHPEATTTVQDGAVTPKKTTFFKQETVYANLFDVDNTEQGIIVYCDTATTGSHGSAYTCPAFPVTPGKSYYIGKANGTMGDGMVSVKSWAFYDENMNHLAQSAPTAMGGWNPIPEGVAYMRVSGYYWAFVTGTMVVEGTEPPSAYVSYSDGITIEQGWADENLRKAVLEDAAAYMEENLSLDGNRVKDGSIAVEKSEFVKIYNLNLINPDEITTGYSVNNKGVEGADQYRDVTGYCPVLSGRTYWANAFNQNISWYDSEKNFLAKSSNSGVTVFSGHVAPEGAAFARLNISTGMQYAMLSDYGPCPCTTNHYIAYGTQKIVYHDELVNDAMKQAVETAGNISGFSWKRWNIADEYLYFSGSLSADTGLPSFVGSGGNAAGYIVSVTPGTEYVIKGANSNDNIVYQYAADWSYVGSKTVSVSGVLMGYAFFYTPDDGVAHAIIDANGFVAVSDEDSNEYSVYLSTHANEFADNLAVKYIPTGIPDYARKKIITTLLENESDALLQAIHGSKGLKWNCLGDSLTTLSWGSNMYNIVADKLGITPVNYGIVSSTIADYSNDGTTGDPMCVRYTEMDDDADIVTVMGGVNDTYSSIGTMADRTNQTMYGACHNLFSGLIEKYPNAKIGVILTPQYGKGVPSYVETQGGDPNLERLRAKVNAVREVAEYYSLPVCDLFNHGGISGVLPSTIGRLLQADYLHITTEGYKVLSRPLLAFMKDLIG